MTRILTGWLLLVAALIGPGCDRSPPASTPLVVASFYPLGEFSRQVAGERARVVVLVPTGVEPHDWEPAPRDIAQVKAAQLIVLNGAGLEPWAGRLAGEAGPAAVVVTTEDLPLAPVAAHGEPAGAPSPGDGADPHVWLDPRLARAQVEAIRAGLARVDPAGAPVYARNAQAYAERLAALDRAFEEGLRDCARRDLVVSHAAFGYLARRYRLTMVPVMGVAAQAEPSPAQLAAIVRLARARGVRAIFAETLVNPRLAETLAREVGARALVLNPIEGLTREEAAAGKDYLALMEDNLRALRDGLDCR